MVFFWLFCGVLLLVLARTVRRDERRVQRRIAAALSGGLDPGSSHSFSDDTSGRLEGSWFYQSRDKQPLPSACAIATVPPIPNATHQQVHINVSGMLRVENTWHGPSEWFHTSATSPHGLNAAGYQELGMRSDPDLEDTRRSRPTAYGQGITRPEDSFRVSDIGLSAAPGQSSDEIFGKDVPMRAPLLVLDDAQTIARQKPSKIVDI